MNMTIELSDEQAAGFKMQAEGQGLTVERWLEQFAAQSGAVYVDRLAEQDRGSNS